MNAYLQQNPTVKMSPRLATEMPQFMLLKHHETGVLTGRLYVPAAWARLKSFQSWLTSVEVIWTKHLGNGNLTMWIATNHAEYERLLKTYPHHNQFNRGKSWEYLRAVKPVQPVTETAVVEPVASTPAVEVVEQFTGYAEPVVEAEPKEDLTLGIDAEVVQPEVKPIAKNWEPKTRGELRSMIKKELYRYGKTLVADNGVSPYITTKLNKTQLINNIEAWLKANS